MDCVHYCFSNIQLMTWQENKNKAHADSKTDKLSTRVEKKQVSQCTKGGKFIATYISAREAGRQTGIPSNSISDVCRKRPHHITAGGFKWQFTE